MNFFSVIKKLSVATASAALMALGATATTQAATTINGISSPKLQARSLALVAPTPALQSSNPIASVSTVTEALPTSNLTLNGPWYEFSFNAVGVAAKGCAPADPGGLNCAGSSAGNSVFVGTPAWKFVAPEVGASLKVTDAYAPGDVFDVFDFGNLIGSTSAANTSDPSCGDNPDTCFADPLLSKGEFNLASGLHSITIIPTENPFNQGAAYFRIDANAKSVPEPAAILGLLATLFPGVGVLRRHKVTTM